MLEEAIYLAHAVVTDPGETTVVRPRLETDRAVPGTQPHRPTPAALG